MSARAAAEAAPAPVARGWLLALGHGHYCTVGEREMLYLLPELPRLYRLPGAAAHAQHVMLWRQKPVPVVDVGRLVGAPPLRGSSDDKLWSLALVAFESAGHRGARRVELGALMLAGIPTLIDIGDDAAAELSPDAARRGWDRIGHACFIHPVRGAVPVLDLQALFVAQPESSSLSVSREVCSDADAPLLG